jgi:hypothetical protein
VDAWEPPQDLPERLRLYLVEVDEEGPMSPGPAFDLVVPLATSRKTSCGEMSRDSSINACNRCQRLSKTSGG